MQNSTELEEHSRQGDEANVDRLVRATAVACGVGYLTRSIVTLNSALFEDALSLMDLVADYVVENPWAFVGISVGTAAISAYVTWEYWAPSAQNSVSSVVVKTVACCKRIPDAEAAVAAAENRVAQCAPPCRMTQSIPWLLVVSTASSLSTVALAANENEEGMRMIFGLAKSTPATAAVSLILGGVATVYSGFTELRNVWLVRLYGENTDAFDQARNKYNLVRHVIAFAGPLELGFRTGVVIYLSSKELVDNEPLAIVSTSVIALFGTVQNFCFQGVSAIDDSWTDKIDLFLHKLPLPVKITFLSVNGFITIVVNMALSTFNISTLLVSIVNGRLGFALSKQANLGIALTSAAVTTFLDVCSSLIDGMVKPMLGLERPGQAAVPVVPRASRGLLEGANSYYLSSRFRIRFSSQTSARPREERSHDFELDEVAPLEVGVPRIGPQRTE